MIITHIHIDLFGGIRDLDLDLAPGVTLIEGANESGKSTIAAFLKFIFYGLSGRAKGNRPAERTKWLNWEENRASGRIDLTTEGRSIRIERSIAASGRTAARETVKVFDAATGHRLNIDPASLCSMPEEVYLRTACIRQTEGAEGDRDSEIAEAVGNLLYSADESVNTRMAEKRLEELRVSLLHKNKRGGKIFELERERDDLEAALAASSADNAELITKEGAAADCKAKIKSNRARLAEVERTLARYENGMLRRLVDREQSLDDRCRRLASHEKELTDRLTQNGYLPDEGYIRSLAVASDALRASIDELSRHEGAMTALDAQAPVHDRGRVAQLKEAGGKITVLEAAERAADKKKKKSIAAWILIALALSVAGLTTLSFVLLNIPVYLLAAGGAAALLMLVTAFLFFGGASKANGELKGQLARFGATSPENLADILTHLTEDAAGLEQLAREHAALEQSASAAKERLHAKSADLAALLQKWNFRTGEGVSALLSAAVEASEAASESIRAIGSAAREREKAASALEATREALARYEKSELADRLADAMTEEEIEGTDRAALERERDFLIGATASLESRLAELDRRIAALGATVRSPAAIADRLAEIHSALESMTARHDACLLAIEALEGAGAHLRETLAPRLSEDAGRVMNAVTGGKYASLGVTPTLDLNVLDGNIRSVDMLSSGTADAAYIALRMALLNLVAGGNPPPILFDEPFARIDDRRLARLLALIVESAGSERQAILLTSQTRDAALLPPSARVIRLS